MKLPALGEDRLIRTLTRLLPTRADVLAGPGDDCAIIGSPRAKRWQLLKVDAVVEGVHFLPGEDLRRVGWKALCRAISDVAAMGGEPQHALITLVTSPREELARLEALYAGLRRAAARYGVAIVGGETSRSKGPLVVSVALTGEVERRFCVRRSGGRPGDLLLVTGRLGGSLAGKHLTFQPRLEAARWLVRHARPRAMMDLSDGLGADLPRLARASGCGFHLQREKIPRTRGCSVEQALSDGEDFELLLSLPPAQYAALAPAWAAEFPRLPLTVIGELTASTTPSSPLAHGFDHFA